ncbi:hypothetical protein SO802_023479 [Lithocarpus litseifolius]|uniref:Zinc knuckle CX2CX4HX4C domain-containing protein n=1 Tax=Lithocarpus litseifolius TaxID=425828 RepID=A0AAW2C7Q1_9ROSI
MVQTQYRNSTLKSILLGSDPSVTFLSHLTEEVALSLGETLGLVISSKDPSEMNGGTFIRVRVSLNILEPICCSRRISFRHNFDDWVSFMYERLPNICYCCGMFTYDDKECATWLRSKDFKDVIKDINDEINQGSNISNSNIPSHVTINGTVGSIIGQDANGADQNVRNGPKRKGEFSNLVSTELGEKEKRVKRDDEILALPTFMGLVEVVEQPCRVQ